MARRGRALNERVRLYVMRHGPAEADAPSGRDEDRRLTDAGRARVALVTSELVRRSAVPARVFSSPLVRAMQTAEIVREVCGLGGDLELRDELAPTEGASELVRELAAAGVGDVLVVSHAPDVSILVQLLTGARAPAFSAGMIVALDVAESGAQHVFTLDP